MQGRGVEALSLKSYVSQKSNIYMFFNPHRVMCIAIGMQTCLKDSEPSPLKFNRFIKMHEK